jgi:hypothetical protein
MGGRWDAYGAGLQRSAHRFPAGGLGQEDAFTGTTVLRVTNGLITEELGIDDAVTVLKQLGLIPNA